MFLASKVLWLLSNLEEAVTQPAAICSKVTIETLEQGMIYVES